MKTSKSVNTVEAKNRLNALIEEIKHTHNSIFIQKRGETAAVLVDYETFKMLSESKTPSLKKDDAEFLKRLKSFHKHLLKKYPQGLGDSSEKELKKMREEHDGRL